MAHNSIKMLCMNFTKIDLAEDGKENVLVLTDTFSKFSQAFVCHPNQKGLTIVKNLVNIWFYVYGNPAKFITAKVTV